MKYLAIFGILAVLFGCRGGAVSSQSAQVPLVQLETTRCRGYCPAYTLLFYRNGAALYNGLYFVQKAGEHRFQLTPAELKRLEAAVQTANLWQYPSKIESQVADAPWSVLTVYHDARKYEVSGSVDRPQPLLDLEDLMKDLAEVHGLPVREGVNPDILPAATRQTVVVLLKPEINAGNWLMQFSDIRLQLLHRTGEQNEWIVAFDPKEISQEGLIDLFKDMEGVLKVGAQE
jgi:hypothetical protein